MTLVKCQQCGAKIDRETAYKVVVGKVNRYYCNEQEANKAQEANQVKCHLYQLVDDIFGRHVINSILYKEMQEVAVQYGYPLLREYVLANRIYLGQCMAREFSSEYAQIRYFMAIVRNNIQTFKMRNKVEPVKTTDFEFHQAIYQARTQRKGFADIE